MKTMGLCAVVVCLWAAPTASAAEELPSRIASVTLTDGRTLEAVRVLDVTPSNVMVIHKGGAETVKLSAFPPELRDRFGYDETKAKAYDAAQAVAGEEAQHQMAKITKVREDAHREAAEQKAIRAALKARAWAAGFDVLQVTKAGILATSGSESQMYFIVGFTEETYEGKQISGYFVDAGTHTFKDTQGASRTVKRLSFVEKL